MHGLLTSTDDKTLSVSLLQTSAQKNYLAVMAQVRFPLSFRNVEDIRHERGIDVSHSTAQFWWNRFGLMIAVEIPRKINEAFWLARNHRHGLV